MKDTESSKNHNNGNVGGLRRNHNRQSNSWQPRQNQNSSNQMDWRNNERNYGRSRQFTANNGPNYPNRSNTNRYAYNNNNSNFQRDRYQNPRRATHSMNLCSEHYCRGQAANMQYCKPGCRYNEAKICYAHWKFGDQAWQSKCASFCQHYAGHNQNYARYPKNGRGGATSQSQDY